MLTTLIDYLLCYMNAFLFGMIVGIGIMLYLQITEGRKYE